MSNISMKKIVSLILLVCNIFSFAYIKNVEAQSQGNVIISVEKFTIGLGYSRVPTKVSFEEGETSAQIMARFLGEGNYKNWGSIESGFYISAIKDDDSRKINVPNCISDNISVGEPLVDGFIGEGDYTAQAGWMMLVNNEFLSVGASDYKPNDGDVIRLEFSLCWGSDIGGGWDVNYVTPANKDALTKAVALAEDKTDPNVVAAYEVLENMESTDEQIELALQSLGSPTEPEEVDVSSAIKNTASVMLDKLPNPTVQSGSEWTVLALARSGYGVPNGYYKTYYNNVVDYLKKNNGILSNTKYTEYSRVILALESIGKAPDSVGGYDMFKPLSDFDKVKYQGITGPIWALIAFDSNNNNKIPSADEGKTQATKDTLIDYILSLEKADGGFSLSDSANEADVDTTAMVLQALAKYKSDEKIAPYVGRALTVLSNKQQQDGGFLSNDNILNLESTAQVVIALTSLGIDPKTDTRFIKNGNDIISVLLKFYVDGGGFSHILNSSVDGMATDQAMCALVSYKRFINGETGIYDMSDTKVLIDENSFLGSSSHSYGENAPLESKAPEITEITVNDTESEDVVLNAQSGSKGIKAKLSGAVIDKIKQGIITLSSDNIVCSLPASSIDIDSIMNDLAEDDKSKVTIQIVLMPMEDEDSNKIKVMANAEILVSPIKFAVTAQTGYKKLNLNMLKKLATVKIKLNNNDKASTAVTSEFSALISKVSDDYLVVKTFGSCNILGVYSDKGFSDIEDYWAKGEIKKLADKLIINGSDENTFEPERNITRAEFAVIISKALGFPKDDSVIFDDVNQADWFAPYVASAVEYGLLKGKSDKNFAPYDNITREETAVILERAANLCGIGSPVTESEIRDLLAQFVDYTDSSDWSVNSLAFNVKNGFISERNIDLRPTAEISRAEAAVMINRLLEKADF